MRVDGIEMNGPLNVTKCKNAEFWEQRWRPSDNMKITKVAKTRPNEPILSRNLLG